MKRTFGITDLNTLIIWIQVILGAFQRPLDDFDDTTIFFRIFLIFNNLLHTFNFAELGLPINNSYILTYSENYNQLHRFVNNLIKIFRSIQHIVFSTLYAPIFIQYLLYSQITTYSTNFLESPCKIY